MSLKINDERPVLVNVTTSGGPTEEQIIGKIVDYTGVSAEDVIVISSQQIYAVRLGANWTPSAAATSSGDISVFFTQNLSLQGYDLSGAAIPTSIIQNLSISVDV